MRRLAIIMLIMLALFMSGCTRTSDRIYSVCKIQDGFTYCYNSEGSFYIIDSRGDIVKTSGVGLKALPALHIVPVAGSYKFTYILPGLYNGTLESVNKYVYKIMTDDSGDVELSYCDWNNVEVYLHTASYSVRIIFNVTGEVRIYAIDSSGNAMKPPYLGDVT